MSDLGKFVTTLRDKCEICNSRLQVRSHDSHYVGTRFFTNEEIICPNCGYSLKIKPQKRRVRGGDSDYGDDY